MRLGSDVVKVDLYAELGVAPDSSFEIIQRAYRRLVRLSHPDLSPSDQEALRRMVRLNRAAQILLNPHLREAYDRLREQTATDTASPARTPAAWGGGSKRGAWFDRRTQASAQNPGGYDDDWVSHVSATQPVAREGECDEFLRQLRGKHGDRLVRLGEHAQRWAAPRQRELAGALFAIAVTMILSLRPVTLGIGPDHAQQPLSVAAEALTP